MKRKYLRYCFRMIILLGASVLLISCGSSGGGSGEDVTTAAIALSVSPDFIPADGRSSATITADLTDKSGTAVPKETCVTFSTTLGSFPNGSTTYKVKTPNDSGSVTVSLIAATTTGNAEVVAKSNNVTQKAALEFIDGPVGSVSVVLGAESIVADGTSQVLVTATVLDTNGNNVPDGTTVSFTTTAGDLDSTTAGIQSTVSSTTTSGIATATLTSPTNVGTATIYAEAQGVSGTATISFVPGAVDTILLGATPKTLAADGTSTSTITAFVTDAHGNAAEDEVISFSLSPRLGTLSSPIGVTSGGVATVTYTASTTSGTERVTAASANGVSTTVDLTLTDSSLVPRKISLSASQISVKSDNSDSATITATVLDAHNAVVEGITVAFSTTGGQLSAASADTDDNGQAIVTFSSGITDPSNQVVTITATVTDLEPAQIPIQVTGSTLALATDKTQIPSDGSASAVLTATAKDAGGTAVYHTPVTWTVSETGGGSVMLSSFVIEDNTRIGFADSNPDTITRSDTGSFIDDGFEAGDQIGVQGSVQNDGNYTVQSVEATTLTLIPGDTLNSEASGAPVTITRAMSTPFAVHTDVTGEVKVLVTGTGDGSVTVFAEGLGETATQEYTVSPPGTEFFHISDPTEDPSYLSIGENLTITVTAPDPTTSVVFVATFGAWDGGISSVVTKSVTNGSVSAVFSSTLAGVASIQVYDEDNPSDADSMEIVVSAAIDDAAHILLQSNTYVVPLSTGGNSYTATLTASVRTSFASGRQPVGGASVAFSIDNQTGGGETVFPAIVFTDDSGVATTTFTSGSLSSGAEGVEITATVLGQGNTGSLTTLSFNDANPDTITRSDAGSFVTDGFQAGEQIRVEGSASNDGDYTIATVSSKTLTLDSNDVLTAEPAGSSVTITAVTTSINIVVGGTSGSIVIGRGSEIEILSPTTYSLPMSVLVADSNGNPQSGAVVSLSTWPEFYSTGNWVRRVQVDFDPETGLFTQEVLDVCDLDITGTYPNEDANENLFLDPGEDTGTDPGHGDGQLTPPNSAAGTIPMTVTTEANGVANFDLVYMKSSAKWIIDRIRASTVVLGTETTSSMSFRLPAEKQEAEGCQLPNSPYNPPTGTLDVDNISLTATPNNLTADGTSLSTITAVVTDVNGNAIDGEVITFELTAGTGTLSSQKATSSNGVATITYTASTTPGTETITASADNGVTATVNITLIEGMVGSVSVSAGSDSIVANGTSQVLIMATVLDQNGKNVADGTAVSFTTTAGNLSDISSTINGVARATLTSSTNVGTATIEAIAGGVIGRTTVAFISGPVGNIQLTATPNNLTADGASTSTIYALVTDGNGNVVNDETVSFAITSGTGVLDNNIDTTDGGGGVAEVTYTASTTPGTVTVTARTTNGTSATVNIVLIGASVGSVTCSAGCDQIVVGGGTPILISAVVTDSSGNPVPDGTAVSFTTTAGTLSDITPTTNGVATANLWSSNNVGTATIKITAGGVCCELSVEFIAGPVANISLTATQEVLTANGTDTSTIRAFVTDANGNPVDGATITFTLASIGSLSASTAETNGGGGVAEVTYTAGMSEGIDTVTATAVNGTSGTITINLVGASDTVGSVILAATETSGKVANGTDSYTITAQVLDPSDDPMSNQLVEFSASGHTGLVAINPPVAVTGADGTTTCSVTDISSANDTVTIDASSGGIPAVGSIGLAFTGTGGGGGVTVGSVILAATETTGKEANGVDSYTVTVQVLDTTGQPMNNQAVTFSASGNSGLVAINPPVTTTEADGTATCEVTDISDVSDTVDISASSGGVPSASSITLHFAVPEGPGVPVSLGLATSQIGVKSDNSDSATITATVLDADNAVVEGITVEFSADGGQISAPSAVTDENGQAEVVFSSGTVEQSNRVVTITASVSGLPDKQIPILVVGSTVTITTDRTVITDDGGTTATLTVVAKDASGTPVYDTPISFTTTGAGSVTLTPPSGNTDINGRLVVTVTGDSAGDVTVTADGLGATATQDYDVIVAGAIFFRIIQPQSDPISWSTVDPGPTAITGPSTQIAFVDSNPDTIVRSDGGDFLNVDGFRPGDRVMVGGSTSNDTDAGAGTPLYYTIDTAGVTASTLTLIASDELTAEAAGATVTVTNGIMVTVEAPAPTTSVTFATTFGAWDGGESTVVKKNVAGGFASAVFSSRLAGVGSIQVTADDDPTSFDTFLAVISAPSADAAHITLQSNTYVVPLSTGGIDNTATLTASVRTSSATGRQPVGGAPVVFTIDNQTGGGETIFPVIVYTDASGTANTTFTSGSLSSGAEGVIITAKVLDQASTESNQIAFVDSNPDTIVRSDGGDFTTENGGYEDGEQIRVEGSASNDGWYIVGSVTASTLTLHPGDTLTDEAAGASVSITAVTAATNIVVGGTAGSLVIGRGSEITILSPTTYSLPMSVLVADSNGNPVSGTAVSLNAWPIEYSTGEWVEIVILTSQYCEPNITGTFPNEDVNENLFLDPGEDTGPHPGHGNGELTPPNSAAGTVPRIVTTDANGVANFDLVYMKSSATWIVDRIRASTLVLGTETTSSMTFRLPYERNEAWLCRLPDSPYNSELPVDYISITADPNNLTADGSSTSTIRAQVFDSNGIAVEGEAVSFEVTTGTGTLSVPTSTTDDQGVAEIIYFASTTAGTETVTVTSANGTTNAVDIVLIEPRISSLEVTAGSNSIVADGASQVTISATVLDANGNNVQDGTVVTFTTTVGTLSGVTATVNGVATATLTSSTNVGTATVRATAGGVIGSDTVDFVPGAVSAISLRATPNNLTADGASTSTIRALVTDANGNAVGNETLTFTITTGTGTLSSQTAITSNGIATIGYTASTVVGTETVRAEATNSAVFDTVDIDLINVVVGTVITSTGSNTAVADGSSQTLIEALVLDNNDNTVPDGTVVTFATSAGTLSGVTTTTNGVATADLTSPTNLGFATVTATAGGVSDSESVTFIAGGASAISLSAAPSNLTADGSSLSTIRAYVTDANGNPTNDETITFSVTTGTGTLSSPTAATINGVANVVYTASDVVGTETVRAEATNPAVFDTTNITLINVVVGQVLASAGSANVIADGSSQTLIKATVQDNNGTNVADGTVVTFATTAGTLSGVTTTTNGVATADLTSPTNVGTATITATSGGVTDSTSVTFIPGPASAISLTATPNNLTADGTSKSTIRAYVTDANGNATEGETISLTITTGTGTLDSQTAITSDGVAMVEYTASDVVGTETVRAEATNSAVFDTTNIDLISAFVGSVTVSVASDTAVADGVSQTLILATVRDTNGNNVADGTVVTFTTTAGSLSGVTTTTNGVASATLTSPTNTGSATIIATAGGVNGSIVVTFVPSAINAISLTATPNNLTADGSSLSTIRAYVTDADNNPVDGELISFRVTTGTGILSAATATVSRGVVLITYTASTTPGTEIITAESTGGVSDQVTITLIGSQIGSIVLTANPSSLPADGASESTISATVSLVGGGDAPDGTAVSFSVVSEPAYTLVPTSITPSASTAAGVATAFLTSSDGVGTATIRAEAGGRRAELEVEFTPGSLTLTIVPNTLLGTGDATANVTATLKDVTGSPPAAGETVFFTLDDLSLGTITPSALSDASGEAVAVFQDAGKGGTVTVTGTWTPGAVDVIGSATIDIQPPPAFIENAEDSPAPAAINIKGTGGQSTSLLTFNVKDSGGNLVADGYRIDFSLESGPNGGENIGPLSAMTAGGQVSTILYSGFKAGPVSIRATYHHDVSVSTTTSQIAISGGPPVGEEFGIFAEYVNISGLWLANLEDDISINAGDIYGNAIPDNTAISFKTYNTGGFFTPNTATTLGGLATNVLHSGGTYLQPLQGFLSVTGEAVNGGRTTHVTSLVVAPSPDTNVLYAGTDGGGVYKSIDSGATWVNISRSSENAKQGQNWLDPHVKGNSAICVDQDDHNRVYVGTGYLGRGNIYRSLDGGMNWNSNNVEEWNGIFDTEEAVLTVLCDGDTTPTDYPYVWVGTEGLGAVFATDGESFQWGGLATVPADPAPPNTGTGTMSQSTLSSSSQTETWTATYQVTGATASTPVFTDVSGAGADGTMTGVSATASTATETWTATYTGGVSILYNTPTPFVPPVPGNDLTVLSTSESTFNETWTVTCIDDSFTGSATLGSELFSVVGSVSGSNNQATANVNYTSNNQELTFVITGLGYTIGDTLSFITTRDGWSVAGTVSGAMTNVARTDTAYTSDNDEVSFLITSGTNRFYQTGDIWTFNTTTTGDWEVVGTVSGTQVNRARNDVLYTSDNYEVTFLISSGATAFDGGDDFSFSVTESGLGYGKVVRDIVKVPGTHGNTAVLYAGTATGVFRSTDGGILWNPTTRFTGDFITTLALHPTTAGVIYAGTEDAGVWVSFDSGTTWTQYTTGKGEGLSATIPMADPNNVGNGVMSAVTVASTTQSEIWSATCYAVAPDLFSVTGSISGPQVATVTVGAAYTSDLGEVSFTISDGSSDFIVGDSFTFSTTRDPGRTIKDLLVVSDSIPGNNNDQLYAITYFWGPLEPHAVGNVYVHPLDDDGTESLSTVIGDMEAAASWSEANAGLPEYDPPDDTTLFAQHVMAADASATPPALYIGGEGINHYKATSGSDTGAPAWFESKSGLSNLIMARMPILFTGICEMTILQERVDDVVTFKVYIQDVNGNPPISSSFFHVEYLPDVGENRTLLDLTYPDTYTYQGTWRDPGDPSTNNPFVFVITVSPGDMMRFVFQPHCHPDDVPGCSGRVDEREFIY